MAGTNFLKMYRVSLGEKEPSEFNKWVGEILGTYGIMWRWKTYGETPEGSRILVATMPIGGKAMEEINELGYEFNEIEQEQGAGIHA